MNEQETRTNLILPTIQEAGWDKIEIKDFIYGGLIIGILAPLISVLWCLFVFNNWL